MFSLLPPSVFSNSERQFPTRPAPWMLIMIVIVTNGWTPTRAALTLAMLSIITMLALIEPLSLFQPGCGLGSCRRVVPVYE